MCRWIAYSGGPIYLEELLFKPSHSLIDQSLAARAGETTTNGDGFGVGWYGTGAMPGLYKSVQPAWSDQNLIDLCSQIKSPLFMAHVRSTTARRSSRQTAIRSGMGAGYFSTTAQSATSCASNAISCSRFLRACFPKSPAARIRRSCSSWR